MEERRISVDSGITEKKETENLPKYSSLLDPKKLVGKAERKLGIVSLSTSIALS
jgi:hypothetical protein